VTGLRPLAVGVAALEVALAFVSLAGPVYRLAAAR